MSAPLSNVPRSRSCDKRYYGVCEGIVHAVNDPEHLGRVKVSFPWFDGDTIVEWCRVMQFYAGGGYGAFFVPEIGDEVVVGFVHGDMRVPIVLGGLYNGQDKPSTHRDGDDKNQKLIRTKAGHQILLDDTQKSQRVTISTKGGHELDLSDNAQDQQQIALKTKGGHKLTVDDTGKKITVKSTSGHEVTLDDNGGSLTIKTPSGQSVTLDGQSVTVKASSKVVLDASAVHLGGAGAQQAAILGDAFLALYNTHIHTSPFLGLPTSPPIVPAPAPAVLAKKAKVL
jgi:uncharacterized protein involved in type VI secretion and phage assembly